MRRRRDRYRRQLRRELVHAAGCVVRGCASVDAADELLAEAAELGVRVPRSLRGRFVAVVRAGQD